LYELEVVDNTGKKLRIEGVPENMRRWKKDYLLKFFLYVPDGLFGSAGVINV